MKTNIFKRFVSAALAAVMTFSCTWTAAYAESSEENTLKYAEDTEDNADEKLIAMGSHTSSDTVYPVEGGNIYIRDNVVVDADNSITSAVIPNSVTSIGDDAFAGCSSLTSINIPNSVTSIGNYAFNRCSSLTSISIPNSVTSIGSSAFKGCSSLTSISIPDEVTSIGKEAFYGCSSLTSISIPNSVTSIAYEAFYECSSLTSISIPNGVTSIGDDAFRGCSSLTSISLPNSVTSIGWGAFDGCSSLTSISLPNSVTSIGCGAFDGCSNLTSISIPDSVTSIDDRAFYVCSSLTSINIPNSVTSIGRYAFYGCSSLTSISIPDSVTSIGQDAFKGCTSLKEINVDIANNSYCSVNGILYTKNMKNLICCPGGYSSTSISIPNSVTSIDNSAFRGCSSLTSISIPDSVTSIGEDAFYECSSLTSISIPDSVTSIGEGAFEGCSSLISINIPDSVTSIRWWAFKGCSSLTSISIPDSVTSIGSYAFEGCSSLTSINIPNGVTSIGGSAFNGCSSLTSISIPDSVKYIGEYAFYGCSSLTSINIPDSVTSIGEHAFDGCSSLTSISIPDSVTSIDSVTFSGCSSLTSINIPNGVTSIGNYAFEGCSSLTSISIPNSVTSIGYNAFKGCSSLTCISLPNSVTSIGWGAFDGCSSLTSISIPDSVTSIGSWAFDGCSKDKLTFYVKSGSYAETWAKNKGFKTSNEIPDGFSARLKTDSLYLNTYNLNKTFTISVYTNKSESGAPLDVTWTSSDDSIASVSPAQGRTTADRYYYNGDIQTHSVEGDVVLTATLPNGSNIRFPITVSKDIIKLEKVLINGKEKYDTANPSDNINLTLVFNKPVILNKSLAEQSSRFSLYKDSLSGENVETTGKVALILSDDVYQKDEYTIVIKYPNTAFMPYLYADFKAEVLTPADSGSAKLELDKIFPITLTSYDSEKLYQMKISKTTNIEEAAAQYEKALDAFNENARKQLLNKYPETAGKYESMINTLDSMLTGEERLDAEQREVCRRALYGVLGDIADTKYSFKFDNDPIKMGVELVNTVLHSMDNKQYTFDGLGYQYKATADVFASGGAITGHVSYEKKNTSGGTDVGMIAVSSTKSDCEKAFKEYFEELVHLEITSVMAGVKSLVTYYTEATGLSKYDTIAMFANNPSMHESALKEAGLGSLVDSYNEGKKIASDLKAILRGKDGEESYKALEHLVSIKSDKFFDDPKLTNGYIYYANLKKARENLIDCAQYVLEHKEMPKPKTMIDKALEWIGINCPVNLYVYDENGSEIGSAVNGNVTVNSEKIAIELDGDSTNLYLLTEDKINFKLTAYDHGMLNITREKLQDGVGIGREVFYDIPLVMNDELTSNEISAYSDKLVINTPSGVKESDLILDAEDNGVVEVNCMAENGIVLGAGQYIKGDKVRLAAIANDGFCFDGWYSGDVLIENTNVYEFAANENINITARFKESVNAADDFLFGDADGDNVITASDAAFILQKTLVSTFELPIQKKTDDWLKYADVDCDSSITASDAAFILQKTLVSTFKLPAEK